MLNQRIQGLYGITPDKDLNIDLIENAIKKHNIKILQYRRKAVNVKNKAKEAKNLLNLCICLLYTSPSPRDLSTSRMPSSA